MDTTWRSESSLKASVPLSYPLVILICQAEALMGRRAFTSLFVLVLASWSGPLWTQTSEVDSDLAKGIKQVDDGDYDGAILTLDTTARRLATEPSRTRDLSQAYLYLGIAYVGKGQEAAARARFREALAQAKDLTLSPDNFPPKVINLFEAAREELARTPSAEAAPAQSPSPQPRKKGGGSKPFLILGGIAVAGGGVALAAGGGGGGSSAAPTTTIPADTRKTDTFSASICGYGSTGRQNGTCSYFTTFDVVVSQAGTLDATLTWADSSIFFDMILYDQAGAAVAQSARTTTTTSQLTSPVTPQTACSSCAYHIQVERQDEKGPLTFTLTVRHP
jgi:hypothetical protein